MRSKALFWGGAELSWERILGHDRAIEVLRGYLAGGRTPHALLLEGPSGIGKSLAATEFAKALLCGSKAARHCDDCPSCRRVDSGSHACVTTVDVPKKARRIKIEAVHAILHEAHLRPPEGDTKVIIVPLLERMNPASANAFLKTLEEPPEGTYFVMTSVKPSLLPATILSRCARVRMGRIPLDLVEQVLTSRLSVSVEEATALAVYSGGSPGKAAEAGGGHVAVYRDLVTDRISRLPGADEQALRDGARAVMEAVNEAAEIHEEMTPTEAKRVELLRFIEIALLFFRDVHVLASCGADASIFNSDRSGDVARTAQRTGPDGSRGAITAIERLRRDIVSNCRPEAALIVACGALAGQAARARYEGHPVG